MKKSRLSRDHFSFSLKTNVQEEKEIVFSLWLWVYVSSPKPCVVLPPGPTQPRPPTYWSLCAGQGSRHGWAIQHSTWLSWPYLDPSHTDIILTYSPYESQKVVSKYYFSKHCSSCWCLVTIFKNFQTQHDHIFATPVSVPPTQIWCPAVWATWPWCHGRTIADKTKGSKWTFWVTKLYWEAYFKLKSLILADFKNLNFDCSWTGY